MNVLATGQSIPGDTNYYTPQLVQRLVGTIKSRSPHAIL